MKCQRCGGFAAHVSFSGGPTAIEAWEYDGWKCLNCGHITDPLILENRALQVQRRDGRPAPLGTAVRIPVMTHIAA